MSEASSTSAQALALGTFRPAQGRPRVAAAGAARYPLPWMAVAAGAALAVALRIPFIHAPLTTDEAGYGEVARLWSHGGSLYHDAWVDRPQGLLLVFRALLHVDGGSPAVLRTAAIVVAVLGLVAFAALAQRLTDRGTAAIAVVVLGAVGASPFIESFTLSGELLALLPALLSMLAFVAYLDRRRARWLIATGLLTGCAVLVKQSAFDAGLAATALLLIRDGRRGIRPVLVLGAAALAPVLVAALTAPDLSDWWNAVVAYRGRGDSLLTGSPLFRLFLFVVSGPALAKALAAPLVLAVRGWRSSPLLVRLWFGAAAIGVVGGGNFHAHYYIQLAPPLSLIAAIQLRTWLDHDRTRRTIVPAAFAAAFMVAMTVPAYLGSPAARERAALPLDAHLAGDGAVAAYVRGHTRPGDRILAIPPYATIYYESHRLPALRYLWVRPLQSVPGAMAELQDVLRARRARLVVDVASAEGVTIDDLDTSGATRRELQRGYHVIARVAGARVLTPNR